MQISPMKPSDLLEISNILQTEFDEFWNVKIFLSELENENSIYFVAKIKNEIVGFAGVWNDTFNLHITNIVTKKNYRKQGIGSKLLETLIALAKEKQTNSLTLEVKQTNTQAICLYEKYNFKKIGIRKNYYSQNENAIIMTMYFNKGEIHEWRNMNLRTNN